MLVSALNVISCPAKITELEPTEISLVVDTVTEFPLIAMLVAVEANVKPIERVSPLNPMLPTAGKITGPSDTITVLGAMLIEPLLGASVKELDKLTLLPITVVEGVLGFIVKLEELDLKAWQQNGNIPDEIIQKMLRKRSKQVSDE